MCTACGSPISDEAKKEGNLMSQLRKIHELRSILLIKELYLQKGDFKNES